MISIADLNLILEALALLILVGTTFFVFIEPRWRRRKELQDRVERRIEDSRPRNRKPLSPLVRRLIAERAAALNDPVVKEAHDEPMKRAA